MTEKKKSASDVVLRYRARELDPEDWEAFERKLAGSPSVSSLSDDQARVFDKVMAWWNGRSENQVLTLGGFAGTGKSTLVPIIAKEVRGLSRPATHSTRLKRIAYCAYTGKAANVLRQKLREAGINASSTSENDFSGTIHSLLYFPVLNKDGEVVYWSSKNELNYDLIVVDEASMVDDKVLGDLAKYDIPILAVGDHGQLPPVKSESSLMQNPDLRLEKIHRQAEDNPIIQFSKYVRERGELPDRWDNSKHVKFIKMSELQDTLEPLYETEDAADIAVLTYTNKLRKHMNYMSRCMKNKREMSLVPVVGDQVICLRNLKSTVFNGMRGKLEEVTALDKNFYRGTVFFPDDSLEAKGIFLKSQLGREKTYSDFKEIEDDTGLKMMSWSSTGMLLDYGDALTVHKSQGSQFKHVFLVYERPRFAKSDEFGRWLYTGVTRASEYLYIVEG